MFGQTLNDDFCLWQISFAEKALVSLTFNLLHTSYTVYVLVEIRYEMA